MARPRKPTTTEIQDAAARYEVTPRSIRRWLDAGLAAADLGDLEAVATHLLKQHAPSPAALQSITSQIQ